MQASERSPRMNMKITRVNSVVWAIVGCAALIMTGYGISGCGTGAGTSTTGMSKLTTAITDPAECSAAVGGSYQHAYVTIVDVKANASSSAGASGSGWVDLTPGLKPTQVDLLGPQASGGCFLASLGDNLEVQAGNYQQIRLILGSNTSTMVTGTNYCNQNGSLNAVNCVENSDGTWHALTTPSAEQTGIKIIPSQLSGGSLNLAAGKTEDLVINFQTCESILTAGNSGQYLLEPVLNAGQVSTNSSTINGTVVDAATGKPISGNVLVSLEQPDSTGVDRIVESTRTAADGTFSFCSLLQGTSSTGSYDVVVSGYTPTGSVAYSTAVVTGVQLGDTTGTIKLSTAPYSTATLTGLATTQNSSSTGTAAALNFYPLEANPVTTSSTKYFTVPLLQTATNDLASLPQVTSAGPTYTDASGTVTTCPTNTDCATFSMTVPQEGISVYTYSASGPTAASTTSSTALAAYTVDAQAWETSDTTQTDCSKPELMAAAPAITSGTTTDMPLVVNTTATASAELGFTGCQ